MIFTIVNSQEDKKEPPKEEKKEPLKEEKKETDGKPDANTKCTCNKVDEKCKAYAELEMKLFNQYLNKSILDILQKWKPDEKEQQAIKSCFDDVDSESSEEKAAAPNGPSFQDNSGSGYSPYSQNNYYPPPIYAPYQNPYVDTIRLMRFGMYPPLNPSPWSYIPLMAYNPYLPYGK